LSAALGYLLAKTIGLKLLVDIDFMLLVDTGSITGLTFAIAFTP